MPRRDFLQLGIGGVLGLSGLTVSILFILPIPAAFFGAWYAGRDGNVYRRAEDGGWQKYENGNWGNVDRPEGGTGAATQRAGQGATAGTTSSTYGQLEKDRSARTSGTQRTNDYGSVRSNPTTRNYGSYRGGGASRGGGGRRRVESPDGSRRRDPDQGEPHRGRRWCRAGSRWSSVKRP